MNPYEDLLARLQAARSEEERTWITLDFNLSKQKKNIRTVVEAAALLHWFDKAMLEFVLETSLSKSEFQTLLALPYVEEFPGRGWNVHEKSRDLLRDKLWEVDQPRYRKLSRRAAAWCRKRQASAAWWQVEALYHALLGGEKGAECSFLELSTVWHNHLRHNELETSVRPLVIAARVGRLKGASAFWSHYWQARLDILYSRNRSACEALEWVLARDPAEMLLRAHCIQALGDVHKNLSERLQANNRYEEALAIYRVLEERLGEANCIKALGNIHQSLAEWSQANNRYEEALAIYRALGERLGEANCIRSLGSLCQSRAEWTEARKRHEEALTIYRDIGDRLGEANCIRELGCVVGETGRLDEALTYFREAAQKYRELGLPASEAKCFNSMAIELLIAQRTEGALQAFSKAIELFPEADYYTNRSEPFMQLGDFSAAQRDLDVAAELNPDYDYLHFNRGRLALWQGEAQVAQAWFDKAVEKLPNYGEFHLWLALTLVLNGVEWREELNIGLERTYLPRQIREAAEATEKLEATYGVGKLAEPRAVLLAELEKRNTSEGPPQNNVDG